MFRKFKYASGVQLADVGAVSAYFVHSKIPVEEFMMGVWEVRFFFFRRRVAKGVSKLVFGCERSCERSEQVGFGVWTGTFYREQYNGTATDLVY